MYRRPVHFRCSCCDGWPENGDFQEIKHFQARNVGLSQEKKGDTIGSQEQKDEELISADISPTKGSFFFPASPTRRRRNTYLNRLFFAHPKMTSCKSGVPLTEVGNLGYSPLFEHSHKGAPSTRLTNDEIPTWCICKSGKTRTYNHWSPNPKYNKH
jgi:hypothetical protein